MAQAEILGYLKNNSNMLYTAKELGMIFDLNPSMVAVNLRRLKYFGEIPVFCLYRGTSKIPFYTYIEKARKHIHRRGKHPIENNKTMMRI